MFSIIFQLIYYSYHKIESAVNYFSIFLSKPLGLVRYVNMRFDANQEISKTLILQENRLKKAVPKDIECHENWLIRTSTMMEVDGQFKNWYRK